MGYNILFIGWECPPRGGGVGTYMWNMAQALSRLDHDVVFMTGKMQGLPSRERLDNLTVYRCYNQGEHRHKRFVNKVLKIVQAHKIDWIEGADYLGECNLLLKDRNCPPIVIKAHSCDALTILRKAEVLYSWQKPLIKLALLRNYKKLSEEKFCLKECDYLIAPSWRIIEELIKDDLISSKSIGVIPNTIAKLSNSIGQENCVPTILFPGKISIGKGIQYLPRILSRIKIPNLRVEIAGDDTYARGIGSLKNWLKMKLEGKNINGVFLGRLNRDEMIQAYLRSWVVILPTKWDNFPNVVLESMQLGKSVVTSPFGGMVEMLEGTEGCVAIPESVEFSNAVEQLLSDQGLRTRVGESMREKFEKVYSPEHVAPKYIKHISKNISDSR